MSVLVDKLKSFDYYKNKLPLYLQNSYGIVDQFKIWHTILLESVEISDNILDLLNIFDENYLEYIEQYKKDTNSTIDILDKLAQLFGYGRNIQVKYTNQNVINVTENISLNDREILILIKAQIIKNYYNGSRESLVSLYNDVLKLPILYTTDRDFSANCQIYFIGQPPVDPQDTRWNWEEWGYTENIGKMFLAGLLTINSIGINYTTSVYTIAEILIWRAAAIEDRYGWEDPDNNTGGLWSV